MLNWNAIDFISAMLNNNNNNNNNSNNNNNNNNNIIIYKNGISKNNKFIRR